MNIHTTKKGYVMRIKNSLSILALLLVVLAGCAESTTAHKSAPVYSGGGSSGGNPYGGLQDTRPDGNVGGLVSGGNVVTRPNEVGPVADDNVSTPPGKITSPVTGAGGGSSSTGTTGGGAGGAGPTNPGGTNTGTTGGGSPTSTDAGNSNSFGPISS